MGGTYTICASETVLHEVVCVQVVSLRECMRALCCSSSLQEEVLAEYVSGRSDEMSRLKKFVEELASCVVRFARDSRLGHFPRAATAISREICIGHFA
eukprot:3842252-Pleurochrysis_carterae.AAC.1